MALVPCRECGKEVSDEAEVCPSCGIKTPSKKRYQRKMYMNIGVLVALLSLLGFGYYKFTHPAENKEGMPAAKPSVIQKDVPIKDQVIQKDDKAIVKELLDSGESVYKISKQTGIRRDVIRKIKKEKN